MRENRCSLQVFEDNQWFPKFDNLVLNKVVLIHKISPKLPKNASRGAERSLAPTRLRHCIKSSKISPSVSIHFPVRSIIIYLNDLTSAKGLWCNPPISYEPNLPLYLHLTNLLPIDTIGSHEFGKSKWLILYGFVLNMRINWIFFRWACPTSIHEFSGCGYVRTCMRVYVLENFWLLNWLWQW